MENELLHAEQETTQKKESLRELYSTVELLAIAAAIILLFFSFIARLTVVEGGSMENTLLGGDKLVISNLFYTPDRGDIVIVQSPKVNDGVAIVKRVIAVEGDTVAIRKDGVYVNGERLNETDGSLGYTIEAYSYRPMAPQVIGKDKVFVLGDHRSVSLDSRSFGQVDESAVIGRVLFRIFPLSSFGAVD
ncbi:MAG: signal peptidase I [Ruminococcaceae bacterium]|nr:signal peptidase I [Oscillospiraceae bacterium]